MTKSWLGRGVLIWVALSAGSLAHAQDREIDAAVGTRKVVKRGTLASMSKQMVPIAGRGQVPIADVASEAFEDQSALTGQLRKARAGLQADPVEETDVVETDTATILSRTTRAVVVDPDAVRKASPDFAQFRSGKQKAKLSELDAKTRTAFDELYARAKTFAADHPLRKAADKSEQALLDAVVEGKGDMAVTTTIVIPKNGRKRDAKGKLLAPSRAADGNLVLNPTATPLTRSAAVLRETSAPEETVKGEKSYTFNLLTGFTEGDSWEWSRRWDFPTGGYFRVKASAWYDYGLRVPVEVTSTIEPTSIHSTGDDKDSEYEVAVEARVLDGDKAFYESTGLASSLVHDGKELVLEAGFQVTFTLHVLGTDIHERLPKNDAFDFSQSFRPPFGDCGTDCGFNVWIPAEVTHTGVNILGIIKGSVRAGVNVGGDGRAKLDFEAIYDHDPADSWLKGDKKSAKKKQTLALDKPGQAKNIVCAAPKLDGVSSVPFGYRISNPRYDWTLTLTPGVRADVDVHLWPIKETFTVNPLWLKALAIKLGTITLGPHDGTKSSYTRKPGEKSGAPVLKPVSAGRDSAIKGAVPAAASVH